MPEGQQVFGVSKEVIKELKEGIEGIKKWSRIQGLDVLRSIIKDFEDVDLVIYNRADGDTTTHEIAENVPVGQSTVSNRLKYWGEIEIVEKAGRKWKHIAPLSALGIEEPELEDEEE